MKQCVFIVLFLALLQLCAGQNQTCFAVGASNKTYSGYSMLSHADLISGSTQAAFISEYNSGPGFMDMGETGIQACCFKVLEGYLYQGIREWWNPYDSSGDRICQSSVQSPVLLGTDFQYWPTLNSSILSASLTNPRGCEGTSYALFTRCSAPPSGKSNCCYYYSCDEDQSAASCVSYGSPCPPMSDFVLVTNMTVSSCSKCSAGEVLHLEKYHQ